MKKVKTTTIVLLSQLALICISPLQMLSCAWHSYVLKDQTTFSSLKQAYALVLTTIDEFVKKTYPNATDIEIRNHELTPDQRTVIQDKSGVTLDLNMDRNFEFRIVRKDSQILGYVVQDAVKGKWDPIHYAIAITPSGLVNSVSVLEYRERRGKPVAKRRFLKQFKGKSISDSIKVMKDIRGITGASISSNGMTNGIRKVLHIFNELYSS